MYTEICAHQPAAYLRMLQYAFSHEFVFSFVWRDQLAFRPSASDIADILEPFLIGEVHTDRWPGTKVFGTRAWFRVYRFDDESLKCLSRHTSLFQWRAPDYPEDLAIFDATGRCCVAAISHEESAWIDFDVLRCEDEEMRASSWRLSGRTTEIDFVGVHDLIRTSES